MPRIDGLHLTKNIKENSELRKMCVLLYSSIVTADNRKKGEAVKADGMITKPELSKIVELADELIVKRSSSVQQTPVTPTEVVGCVAETEDGSNATQDTAGEADTGDQQTATAESVSPPEGAENDAPTPEPPSVDATVNEISQLGPTESVFGAGLWGMFRTELADYVDQLRELCRRAVAEAPNDEVVNDTFRILHSIKSAAMVVPVDAVTRETHIAEDIMDVVRQDKSAWPHAELNKYVDWLRELADPTYDENQVETVLANTPQLEKETAAGAST